MKKLIAFILVFTMLCSFCPQNVLALTNSISLDEETFTITLEGDVSQGTVYVALYSDDGIMQTLKTYPAQETINVEFEYGDLGDSAKIFWINDTTLKPMCNFKFVDRITLNRTRTPEQLKELNNNQYPEIEMNEDESIGLFSGVYSEQKVDDVNDAIESLENVKTILNIEDVSEEFVPFDDEGSTIDDGVYKIQQVYNGVPVSCAQTIISTDENGYPNSILNRYDDSIKLAEINTIPTITEQQAKEIIINDLSAKSSDYTNIAVDYVYLEILPEEKSLVYSAFANCNNSLGWNYTVDAHSGWIISANQNIPLSSGNDILFYSEEAYYNSLNPNNKDTIDVIVVKNFGKTFNGKNKFVFEDDLNNISVYNLNERKLSSLSGNELYLFEINSEGRWIDNSNEFHTQGFYGMLNFSKAISAYEDIFKNNRNIELCLCINGGTGPCYHVGIYKDENKHYVWFEFPNDHRIKKLDVIGHEYAHFFQLYHIGEQQMDNMTLGSVYPKNEQKAINLKWAETQAVSEGTADIMGMLTESICNENIIFNSKDFWEFTANGIYNFDHYSPTEEHKDKGDWGLEYNRHVHTTVESMHKCYTEDKPDWGYGIDEVGHSDRYILPQAFKKMVEQSPFTSQKQWFKLWGNAIKKLTPKSGFDDMRLALISSAISLGIDVTAIEAGLNHVGITEKGTIEGNAWYIPYMTIAIKQGLITEVRPNDPITRAELLTMALRKADLYYDGGSSYVEHWAGHNITWAYNNGVLPQEWIDNAYNSKTQKYFLDEPIPRWEAATIIAHVLSLNVEKTGFQYAWLINSDTTKVDYDNFVGTFHDINNPAITENKTELIRLLNYNRGSMSLLTSTSSDERIDGRIDDFISAHGWYDGCWKNSEYRLSTYQVLYYFGMYQLWMDGRFAGKPDDKDGGKIKLFAFDQLTRAEVCKILCCK